jgi:cysteine-rich repeat protein
MLGMRGWVMALACIACACSPGRDLSGSAGDAPDAASRDAPDVTPPDVRDPPRPGDAADGPSDASGDGDPGSDGSGPDAAVCGDGVVSGEERCDDANGVRWDGCHECAVTELAINATTAGSQSWPDVAMREGRFVVAWQSAEQDGDGDGVYARTWADGRLRGGDVQVNEHTAGDQTDPAVALCPGGRFVVAWQSAEQDGDGDGVYARTFGPDGSPEGPERRVNERVEGDQRSPALGADAECGFVVAWQAENQDREGWGIFARRFDGSGAPLGPEEMVNTYELASQTFPDVSAAADGSFVVAWNSTGQDGDEEGVFLQRFDASGAPAGAELQVNEYAYRDQDLPAASLRDDGALLVGWHSWLQDGHEHGVVVRRWTAGGDGGEERLVNTTVEEDQRGVDVASSPAGGVVAWTSHLQDGSGWCVVLRRHGPDGGAEGGEVIAHVYTDGDQAGPAVGIDDEGRHVAVWWSRGQDGSGGGIFAQRFSAAGAPLGALAW